MQGVSGLLAPDNVSLKLTSGYKLEANGYKEVKMTYGTLAQIVTNWPGWQLCDGTNGTPDLRASFIVATAAAANPGAVTGDAYVMPHNHNLATKNTGDPRLQTTSDTPGSNNTGYIAPTGTGVAYALCFIAKP